MDGSVSSRALFVLAAAAASVATAGDGAMLWVANALRPELARALPTPPAVTLAAGHLAGVLAIPLYAAGYLGVARLLAPGGARAARWIAGLGAYGSALGGAVHGITGTWLRARAAGGVPAGDPLAATLDAGAFLVPLWGLVALATAAGSVVFALAVARRRTRLPPAFALASPLALTLGLQLLGLPSPLGRAFLVPAAPNLAHVLFFGALALTRAAAAAPARTR